MIVTKKCKEKIICRDCTVPLLLLVYPMSLSAEFQFNFLFIPTTKRGARMTERDQCPPLSPVYNVLKEVGRLIFKTKNNSKR